MAFTSADRAVIEARELLVQLKDKDQVIVALQSRGMSADDARELVLDLYKQNLWENRKSAIGILIGGCIGVAIFGGILVATGRFFIIWLPLSGIAVLWGFIKMLTASGYEIESEVD